MLPDIAFPIFGQPVVTKAGAVYLEFSINTTFSWIEETTQVRCQPKKKNDTPMTSKEQAIYAIMEDGQYSPGVIQATLKVCNHDKVDLDDLIIFIEDKKPSEDEIINKLADIANRRICSNIPY